ncbi:MAG: hypothetical protein KGL38_03465, partial [Gemmatimonadota bacterium]|nr:hypothetical protein [Gemmatimonadota bacterium]
GGRAVAASHHEGTTPEVLRVWMRSLADAIARSEGAPAALGGQGATATEGVIARTAIAEWRPAAAE